MDIQYLPGPQRFSFYSHHEGGFSKTTSWIAMKYGADIIVFLSMNFGDYLAFLKGPSGCSMLEFMNACKINDVPLRLSCALGLAQIC